MNWIFSTAESGREVMLVKADALTSTLLAAPPVIERIDVLAAKLP